MGCGVVSGCQLKETCVGPMATSRVDPEAGPCGVSIAGAIGRQRVQLRIAAIIAATLQLPKRVAA